VECEREGAMLLPPFLAALFYASINLDGTGALLFPYLRVEAVRSAVRR
jgi:hypothetical protein